MQTDPFNVIRDATSQELFDTYLVVACTYGNRAADHAALTRANKIYSQKGFDPKKDIVLVEGVNSFKSFAGVISEANGLGQKGSLVPQSFDRIQPRGAEGGDHSAD